MLGRRADRPARRCAFLTLPTECRDSLAFTPQVGSWQQAGAAERERGQPRLRRRPGTDRGLLLARLRLRPRGLLSASARPLPRLGLRLPLLNDDDPASPTRAPHPRAGRARRWCGLPQGRDAQPLARRRASGLLAGPARQRVGLQPAGRRLPQRLEDRRLQRPRALLRRPAERRHLPGKARRPGRRSGSREPLRLAARRLPDRQVGRSRHTDHASPASSSPIPATAP